MCDGIHGGFVNLVCVSDVEITSTRNHAQTDAKLQVWEHGRSCAVLSFPLVSFEIGTNLEEQLGVASLAHAIPFLKSLVIEGRNVLHGLHPISVLAWLPFLSLRLGDAGMVRCCTNQNCR